MSIAAVNFEHGVMGIKHKTVGLFLARDFYILLLVGVLSATKEIFLYNKTTTIMTPLLTPQ